MTDYINDYLTANSQPIRTEMRSAQENMQRSKFDDVMLKDLPVAMAYIPCQMLGEVYDPDDALQAGTLFESLDKPFLGKRI